MQADPSKHFSRTETGLAGSWNTSPVDFGEIREFETADVGRFWEAFLESSQSILDDARPLRPATPASPALRSICQQAIRRGSGLSSPEVRSFLRANFQPNRICKDGQEVEAFLTGYYRPEVRASRQRSASFREPLLGRPADLLTLFQGDETSLPPGFSAGRRLPSGNLGIYPSRAEIDGGALSGVTAPVAYVRDAIEAFLIQVQGSARLRFDDGSCVDLTYAGRNGHPYSSIGKRLVADGEVPASEISMDRLKDWVRQHGQEVGEKGRALLHTNASYVFFSASPADERAPGPTGAAGTSLRPLTSIAVDRSIWSYGLPFWVTAEMPWEGRAPSLFSGMTLAQDTGSAIIGPARADLYFGSGDAAGRLAGDIRHPGHMFVFLPRNTP